MNQNKIETSLATFSNKVKRTADEFLKYVGVEFNKNPYLVLFLGSICAFCAIPLLGFIIFATLATLGFVIIFIISEGILLGCSLSFLIGSLMLTALVGASVGVLISGFYFGYKQLERVAIKKEE